MDAGQVVASGGPLHGVVVIDTTAMLMGPYCTLLLAQMGARVIKVEPPEGDIARGIGDTSRTGLGPVYLNLNRGKESIALDLHRPDDREVFDELVRRADVVTHNRPPGSDVRLGLDHATLARLNPRIIVCGMHGFGSDGPYGTLPAYDDVIQAVSGIAAHQTGDGPPSFVRTPLTDKVAGLLAVGAIGAALYERERSGVGQYIEVPMFETLVQFLLLEQQGGYVFDPPRGPSGYARTNSPHRTPMPTRDGSIAVLPSTDGHWRQVFAVLDEPGLASDSRFASIAARTEHIDELYAWMRSRIAERGTDELLAAFRAAGVPAGPVRSIPELFDDPHLRAVGFFEETAQSDLGPLRQARAPLRFSRTTLPTTAASPSLDEDGARLRAELSGRTPTTTPGATPDVDTSPAP